MTQDIYTTRAEQALAASNGDMFIRWNDERIGKTIAVMLGAVVGDDALAESNLAVATDRLAEHVESGLITEDTVGRSGRTWIRLLAVTVYDENGDITQAWRDMVDRVLLPLEDYPVLDEDDFSEREYQNFVDETDFIYGAAGGAVREALAAAGICQFDDVDDDGVIRLLDEAVQNGQTLTDEEASGMGWTVEQFRRRHPDETLPALDRLVAVSA